MVAKEAFGHFRDHDMTDHAAALTYYGLMSLFPALLVGVALLGLVGQSGTVDHVVHYLSSKGAPHATVDLVRSSLNTAIHSHGGAGPLLIGGLVLAVYSAAGAFGAVGRALNAVLETGEDRGFVRRKLTDVGSTLLVIVLVAVCLLLLFLGGGAAHDLFQTIGLGSTAATAWNLLRWPGALLVAMLIYAFVYFAAPDDSGRRFRWISPGAVTGVVIWLAASAGFFVYADNFGSYNATYGAFAAVVILLVWMWLSNVALLFGAEVNAALDRRRSVAGDPVARTPEKVAT